MNERQLMRIFLGLNVALGGAVVVYLWLANHWQAGLAVAVPPPPAATSPPSASDPPSATPTNLAFPAALANQCVASNEPLAAAKSAPAALVPVVPAEKTFTWREVTSPAYRTYMENLRLSGCPADKIQRIVLDDVNELFAHKRLQVAVGNDPQWWRTESFYAMAGFPNVLLERGRQLEEERRELITQLLGREAAAAVKPAPVFWSDVQLTGPVLGRLTPEDHEAVQTVCRDSIARQRAAFDERTGAGQPLTAVELARLREQTRVDLRRTLDESAMEEFLVRYSHNASRLREELRGFDPTPDEFRKIFRATDTIDHAMQLKYGGPEALSARQRQEWQRQRDGAIKEALEPERFLAYLRTKDPLFRQAQLYATQFGAPARAIEPIYEMTKFVEGKRQRILNDAALTPQQKSQALQAVNLEQHKSIQQIVREVHQNVPAARGGGAAE